MSKNAYISCDYQDREMDIVNNITRSLCKEGYIVEFTPQQGIGSFHESIANAIERCDVFISVFSTCYFENSWLNIEFEFTTCLKKARKHILSGNHTKLRPLMLGVLLDEHELPALVKGQIKKNLKLIKNEIELKKYIE